MHADASQCKVLDSCLNEKQLLAVEMLAGGKSIKMILTTIGVDQSTLWRWRQDAAFKEKLRERMAELWSDAGVRLGGMIDPALDVMCEQLAERYDRTRFRAAATILRLSGLSKAIHRAVDV